jgi:branched-chain amino acid transport system permease protein
VVGSFINLRAVFLNASDDLYSQLTFGLGLAGFWIPTVIGAGLGAIGGATYAARPRLRRLLILSSGSILVLGAFAGILRVPLLASPFSDVGRAITASGGGLTVAGAIITIGGAIAYDLGEAIGRRFGALRAGQAGAVAGEIIVGTLFATQASLIGSLFEGGTATFGTVGALIGAPIGLFVGAFVGVGLAKLVQRGVTPRVAALPASRQSFVQMLWRAFMIGLVVVFVLWLPLAAGQFFSQVVVLVALYILMGLGLNITLGLAGLLDLGFVAFFAIGGYTVGLLTSSAEYGIAHWPFWAAVPVAIVVAMLFGAFLGLPILRIRGDYLAIATLGFGEIVHIMAQSNLLLPLLGGPRGIVNIPKPIDVAATDALAGPIQIYYLALAAAAIVAFVAIRLRGSRIGRAWLAIREDEDVAEALGVNLVQTKLLAYMLGAAFAGLGGAIFAALIGAVFPSSINLQVSINVAAIVIVGGMGSIPGVVLGSIFLIGLPELFREFSDYRLLFYGVALILVMRFRPEGLWPSRSTQRELHGAGENIEPVGVASGALVAEFEAEAEA